jgi:hypothetical protein
MILLQCLFLAITPACAHAGAIVRLELTDMGTRDALGNVVDTQPVNQPLAPGSYLAHVYVISDTSLKARLLQFDAAGPLTTVPYDWLGVDIDTGNQPPDSIPNFWFDYRVVGTPFGRFPAQGSLCGFLQCVSTTGDYSDFSDLSARPGPGPVGTVYSLPVESVRMFRFEPGVEVHIGALPITVPELAAAGAAGEYTLDLLYESAADITRGARIDFSFVSPTLWSVVNDQINYAEGSGPLVVSVVPEPATVMLFGFSAAALLFRRNRRA